MYKVLFVGLWIGAFASATALMYVTPDVFGDEDIRETRQFFLFATILGSSFIYWGIARLKNVNLSGSTLVISDLRRGIRVQLNNVERVSGSILITPEIVWLHFKMPTEFGSKVLFMPKARFFAGFTRHPIVKELTDLISNAERNVA